MEVLYNSLTEFGIPMKTVSLIKVCLSDTYSRVRVGKNLSDVFSISNGLKQDALSPLLFNFALGYAIRRVQVNQDGFNLNVHIVFCFKQMMLICWRKRTYYKRRAETLIVARKEIGIEGNAEKTNYMVMSRYQNAGRSHRMKIDNSSFELVEEIIYLGITITYKNSIDEEIRS